MSGMNAIDLIKADHRRLDELFEQMDAAGGFGEKKSIYEDIRDLLDVHTQLEESYFYPLFSEREGFEDLIDEAYDEHAEIREILGELEGLLGPDSEDEFDSRIEELIDSVEHHVGEEESELLPKAEGVLSREDLEALGQKLQVERERFVRRTA